MSLLKREVNEEMAKLKVTPAKIKCPCGCETGGTPHDSEASLYQWWLIHTIVCPICKKVKDKAIKEGGERC